MSRILEVQSTFSSGEASPRLIERRDVQFYYSALERGRNIVVLPQGGFTNAPGLAAESPMRNPLVQVPLASSTVTAPNGGTGANLKDDNPATVLTTSAASGGTFVVAHIDINATPTFVAVDVLDFYTGTAGLEQCLAVQYSQNNSDWTTIQLMDMAAGVINKRSRRFAVPPGSAAITARYVRIVTIGASGIGTVTASGVRVWSEDPYDGSVRLVNFNFRQGQEYTLALTPNNGDVFHLGVWQAAFAVGLDADQLRELDWDQRLDSFVPFHENLQTPLIKRQGRHTEWNFAAYPFANLPRYDFGAIYTNGINAKQRIRLFGLTTGEEFDLTLEGETTAAISISATPSTTLASIINRLEGLPSVQAGLTGDVISDAVFNISFTGGTNAGREWLTMAGTAFDENGTVTVVGLVQGQKAGEDAISTLRGFARTGRFYQQSLLLAGLGSLPRHIMKSVTGSPDDFNTLIKSGIGAMFFEVEGGTANEIVRLHYGAALLAWTSGELFYLDAQALSATEVPRFKSSEQPGIERGVPVVSLEGAVIYLEKGGNILRELRYSEINQNFSAQNISVLSAHLLNSPVDMTHRRSVRSQENDLLHIVNADGTLVYMTALRSENITGFTRRDTNGAFKAVSSDSEQIVRAAVSRTTNGATRLWLERFDQGVVTDNARIVTGTDLTSVPCGAALIGEDLHVFCDSQYIGIRTVEGSGNITGLPASSRIEAGFACLADVIDLPLLKDEEAQRPLARQKRVPALHLSLYETDHIAVEVNGGPTYEVPLAEVGSFQVGQSIGDVPFTGPVHLEGFLGFTETGQVRIRQLRPGRLTVRQMRKEVRI